MRRAMFSVAIVTLVTLPFGSGCDAKKTAKAKTPQEIAQAFCSLKKGMTKKEVETLLGPPSPADSYKKHAEDIKNGGPFKGWVTGLRPMDWPTEIDRTNTDKLTSYYDRGNFYMEMSYDKKGQLIRCHCTTSTGWFKDCAKKQPPAAAN